MASLYLAWVSWLYATDLPAVVIATLANWTGVGA